MCYYASVYALKPKLKSVLHMHNLCNPLWRKQPATPMHTNNGIEFKTTSLLSLGRRGTYTPPSCNFTWPQLLPGYHPGSLEGVGQPSPCATSKGPCGCAVNCGGRWHCPPGTISRVSTLLWLGSQLAKPLPALGTQQSWAERPWGMGDRSPAALGMGAVHAVLKEVLEEQAEAMAPRTVFFPSLAPWRPQRKQGQ